MPALQALRDQGKVRPGQKVLVNGASGGVGTFAVQLANAFGAVVTGVCSTTNAEMVRSMGAEHVIDYTEQDFTKSGERFELLLDIAANHSLSDCRRALTGSGTYVLVGDEGGGRWLGGLKRFFRTPLFSLTVPQKMRAFVARPKSEDLAVLNQLIESGTITPVIDRTYPLNETPEAVRYVGSGHARAKVAITL